MNQAEVMRYGLIMAKVAEMEGMKAFNTKYPHLEGYGEDSFGGIANQIEEIVHKHPDQILGL